MEQVVSSYINLEDSLEEKLKETKQLRENKKSYEEQIIDYMSKNELPEYSTEAGKLKVVTTKTIQSISKKMLLELCADVLEEEAASAFLTELENKRSVKEVTKLKRVKR